MISIRDTARPAHPWATLALILVNLLAYWYAITLGDLRLRQFLDSWGMVPRSVTSFFAGGLSEPGVLVTPLTSMYLHVAALHLASNMLYLWVFGSMVEQLLGWRRYLPFYTLCGLIAAAVQVVASHESEIPAVGASGAIAGLLAAYVVLRPGATIGAIAPRLFYFPDVNLPAALMLGLWLLSQIFGGLVALGPAGSSTAVAWIAHLGGFVSGLVLVLFFRPPRRRTYY